MTKASLKGQLEGLFHSQQLAVLSTHASGQPYCNLVAFAVTDDLKSLLFATTRATRKFENLTADPRVSVLVDNRSNRASDFHTAIAATATGRAEEVRGEDRGRLLPIFLSKHPYLEEFVASPTCALLRVRVNSYYVVRRFQNVEVLTVEP